MKKRIFLFLICLLLLLTGCTAQESSDSSQPESSQNPAESGAALVLVNGDASNRYVLGYNGELTGEQLLEGVSQLFGVELKTNYIDFSEDTIKVDFAEDPFTSPKLEDVEPEAEFSNEKEYGISLLDSLAATLRENFGQDKTIYFSYNGGTLALEDITISADTPYEGISQLENNEITEEEATEKISSILSQQYGEIPFILSAKGQELIQGKTCSIYTAVYETAELGLLASLWMERKFTAMSRLLSPISWFSLRRWISQKTA